MYEILLGVAIFTFGVIYGIIINEHATMNKETKKLREEIKTAKIDDTENLAK